MTEKLVRSRIPEKILANGQKPIIRPASDDEMDELLDKKAVEEDLEFREADTPETVADELTDMGEVLRTRALRWGIGWTELTARMNSKRSTHGGFEEGVVWQGNE